MTKPVRRLATDDRATLKAYLLSYYSRNALHIMYSTYTDNAEAVPDRTKDEVAMRVDVLRDILAIELGLVPAYETEPVARSSSEPAPSKPEPQLMVLNTARRFAENIVFQLEDYCDKIHIAGSIRREKAEVKDIEIVCLPKVFPVKATSLFDLQATKDERLPLFARTVQQLGTVVKGKPDGKFMQIDLPLIRIDLFMPDAEDFYRQYAIRTGSAEFARSQIAGGWKSRGWCGSDRGLRRISDCEPHGKDWKCINPKAEKPPVWQSEREFFDWLGIKWVEPRLRI